MKMRMIVEPRMGKKVLDVGNGRVRQFNPSQTSLYVGIDSSLDMLEKEEDTNIYKICGAAENSPFREGSFDTLFYSYLLHHLSGKDVKGTMQAVKTALCEGLTCLKNEGNVVIIEHCFPTLLERVEKLVYYFIRAFLILTKQSNVFIFSVETLTKTLMESGYRDIKVWKIDDHGRSRWEFVTVMVGLLFIKIPRGLNPAEIIIFEAKK
jgi:ubiquinone/menaquinone biosynthesis C-methylase UbiE